MRRGIRSIYFRNFFSMAMILLVSFLILSFTFSLLSYRFVMQEEREKMVTNAQEAVRLVSAYTSEWDLGGLEVRMALSNISRISGFHFLLCNSEGVVVSCSDDQMSCHHLGMRVTAETMGMISGQSIELTDVEGLYDERRYALAMQIIYSRTGQLAGYIILSSDPGVMSGLWRDFSGIFTTVAVCVMVVAFVISIITTKRQTQPLREMAVAAGKFAKGDFSARVSDTTRKDEIGELTDAFNLMADSLERSENQRRELIANVSHELKTPMTTITGFADGLIDGTIPAERQEHYLRIISSETRRLSRLVRSMLEASQVRDIKADKVKNGSFDIVDTVCLALGSLEQRINDKGLDISATLPEEAINVRGDKDSITQVVYNLIDNAAKFSPEGHVIRVDLWKKGVKAYVSIENDGETIAPGELPLIFDRFHKTDRSRSVDREGVGLGLYIVKTILDAHGEDIFVTSENGVTRFVFTLRLKAEQKAKQEKIEKQETN